MTAPLLIGIAAIGGLGAVVRVLASRSLTGTLAVNLAGAFALGLAAGAGVDGDAYRLFAAGFLGAMTTFSTWMLELQQMAAAGRRGRAFAYLLGSLALGLAAVWLGRSLTL